MANKNSKFHDILLSVVFFFLMLLLLYVLIVFIWWLRLHPLLPSVKAESLSASGFGPSNFAAAKYDFRINITNPNKKIDMWVDHFSLRMVYRDRVVSKVVWDPHWGNRILRNMNREVKFPIINMTKLNDKKKRKRIARDMGRDRRRGAIRFDMVIDIRVEFRSGRVLPTRQQLLKVACKDLNIMFPSPKDCCGSLQEQEVKDCLVKSS